VIEEMNNGRRAKVDLDAQGSSSARHKQLDFRFTALSLTAARRRVSVTTWTGWMRTGRTWKHCGHCSCGHLLAREYRCMSSPATAQGVKWNDKGAEGWFEVSRFFTRRWPSGSSRWCCWWGYHHLGGTAGGHAKIPRKLALLRQQHAIERDRARIAKDIHDDIGAG